MPPPAREQHKFENKVYPATATTTAMSAIGGTSSSLTQNDGATSSDDDAGADSEVDSLLPPEQLICSVIAVTVTFTYSRTYPSEL